MEKALEFSSLVVLLSIAGDSGLVFHSAKATVPARAYYGDTALDRSRTPDRGSRI